LKKNLLVILFFCFNTVFTFSQNNIYSILNKEVVLNYGWAGQSLTLVYENNNYYYIYRDIFGSGLPSIGKIKYSVIFNSEYKITFSEIISISGNIRNTENNDDIYNKDDFFEIFYRDELEVYLNGTKIYINYIIDN
jgi:hypothetical protein